jgi:hypothetical protein
LHQVCRCIEGRIERGQTLEKAVRWFVRQWKGRCFKRLPGRPVRSSRQTILRVLYLWRQGGRTPAAVAGRYRCPRQRIHAAQVHDLVKLCLSPRVGSFAAAYLSEAKDLLAKLEQALKNAAQRDAPGAPDIGAKSPA